MMIYITYSKSNSGVRASYACVKDDMQHFYYRRFDKDTSEQEVFDYIMQFVNSFTVGNDEKFTIISNNKKLIKIIKSAHDTENISFIGKYDSEEARNVFMKLQIAIAKREETND